MFEIEQMEREFDYSLVDNETAEFLRSCEYEMNGIAEDARLKFGRVLKNVQEKLSSYHNGVFVKWYESGGLDKNDVYYSINLYEISRNLENSKKDNFLNAPKTLQKEVMRKNAPEELKGKVFNGDITTNKQYQELKRKLRKEKEEKKQVEQRLKKARESEQNAIKQLEELEDKEAEVIEKEVIKEIDNTDYETIETLKRKIKSMEMTNGEFTQKEKEIKLLKLDASKSVLSTKIKIDEFLQEVAVTSYRRGAIAASSEGTKNKLREGIDDLKNFIKEMEMALDGTIEHQ